MVNLRRRALFGGGSGDFPIMTSDTNPKILAIFYNAGFCASPDVMYKSEAEVMTGDDFGRGNTALFYNSKVQEPFDAFQYFTKTTNLNNNCFYSSEFTSIVLPQTLETIAYEAFRGNRWMTVIIPASVTYINSYNIMYSNYVPTTNQAVTIFEGTTPPDISDWSALGNPNRYEGIYVPDGYVDVYKTAWQNKTAPSHFVGGAEAMLALIKPISEYQSN